MMMILVYLVVYYMCKNKKNKKYELKLSIALRLWVKSN